MEMAGLMDGDGEASGWMCGRKGCVIGKWIDGCRFIAEGSFSSDVHVGVAMNMRQESLVD